MTPRLTKEQAAIIGLYTGICCGPFADIQKLAEKLEGGLVWTHEFESKDWWNTFKELAKPLFLEICYKEDS